MSICICVGVYLIRSEIPSLQQLPALWLSEVLEEVKCSDPSSKLCATRRSAGIPFYIQVTKTNFIADFISQLQSSWDCFNFTYKHLKYVIFSTNYIERKHISIKLKQL